MPKVSVIMPSLNVEKYIRRALDSVINQTLEDIEIICVDASSSDGTWEIIEEYSRKCDRIIAISTHTRSYGYQVNLGIKIASAEYVAILETDDFVQPEMYETLYELARQNECDFVKANYRAFWTQKNNQKVYMNRKNIDDDKLYSKILCPKKYTSLGSSDWYIWTGIYNKDFLNRNNILFTESKGAAFQDIGFLIKTLQFAEHVLYIETPFYNYCIDREGASSNQNKSLIFAYGEFSNKAYDCLQTKPEKELFYARMARSFWLCSREIDCINEENEKYIDWFVEKLQVVIKNGELNKATVGEKIYEQVIGIVENKYSYFETRKEDKEKILCVATCEKVQGVIIFGCGNYGYEAYRWSKENSLKILGFMDNNKDLWHTEIDEIPVYSPDSISELLDDIIFIIGNEKYAKDIRKQLIDLGVSEEYVFEYK